VPAKGTKTGKLKTSLGPCGNLARFALTAGCYRHFSSFNERHPNNAPMAAPTQAAGNVRFLFSGFRACPVLASSQAADREPD
jgi:hypothetical protein